ncbi:MAG: hypothetical protein WAN12_02850 [Candidatus Acidiferrum sp.]
MKKTRLVVASLLIVAGIVFVSFPSRPARAQSVGYVKTGQQAVTATAAQLTGTTYGTLCVKALSTNSISVYLGGAGVTDATGFELTATEVPFCTQVNTGQFYVVASGTGASVSWIITR